MSVAQDSLPGKLISFEGTEGAGKSTVIRRVVAQLQADYPELSIVTTREPGGSVVAEKVREIILNFEMDPWTEALLYQACRSNLYQTLIKPALAHGQWVICDRFIDSTMAYQGHARGIDLEKLRDLNRTSIEGRFPDLTIWLDLDPAIGLARAQDSNRFEEEGLIFQTKVREGYQKESALSPDRWEVLPVEKLTPEQAAEKVYTTLVKRFGLTPSEDS